MKKSLSLAGLALAIMILLPTHAFPRGGGGGRGGDNNNNEQDTPTPRPSPTPTPAPTPVQGIISSVTPFAVSIKATPQSTEQTFKVGNDTVITLNTMPVTIGALKPGMLATITPAADNIYAASVVATLPVAAPPPQDPATASNPQPPPLPPGATSVPLPPGATPPPFFGRMTP